MRVISLRGLDLCSELTVYNTKQKEKNYDYERLTSNLAQKKNNNKIRGTKKIRLFSDQQDQFTWNPLAEWNLMQYVGVRQLD